MADNSYNDGLRSSSADYEGKNIVDTVSNTAGEAVKETAGEGIRQGGKAIRKAIEQAAEKAAEEGAKAKIAEGAATAGAGMTVSGVICYILVFALIIGIIAWIVSSIRDYSYAAKLTEEGEEIMALFHVYVDDLYRPNGYLKDEDRFGVAINSDFREQYQYNSKDNDRNKYKSILAHIEDNDYQFLLCGIWKLCIKEMFIEEYTENDIGEGLKKTKDNQNYVASDREKLYYNWLGSLCEHNPDTNNLVFGWSPDLVYDHKLEPDVDARFNGGSTHYYFNYEALKACLDAFVNEEGNYVLSTDRINDKIKEIRKKNNNNTTQPASTSANKRNNSNPRVELENNEISREEYAEAISSLVMDSLIRGLDSHYYDLYPYETDNGKPDGKPIIGTNGEKVMQKGNGVTYPQDKERTYFQAIRDYFLYCENKIAQHPEKGSAYLPKNEVTKEIQPRLSVYTASFIAYIGGDASGLVELAHQEKGNRGGKYCSAMGWSLVDWCAIYAGWLLQEGAGINPSDYAWSAGVGYWADGLNAKGLLRMRGSGYTPKPGDIIFFTRNGIRTHVGIVIELNGNTVTTSEGNTSADPGSGEYCTRSKVDEHTYDLNDSYIYGYGEVSISIQSGDIAIDLSNKNPKLTISNPDNNYKAISWKQHSGKSLTAAERKVLEITVTGEFGSDPIGCILIAQCMRDALVYKQTEQNIIKLPKNFGYDGYNYRTNDYVSPEAKQAVKYIFDDGGIGVKHRILVMYNPSLCRSDWHESQKFIIAYGGVRFFDFW